MKAATILLIMCMMSCWISSLASEDMLEVYSPISEGNLNCQELELLATYPELKQIILQSLELASNLSRLYHPESSILIRGTEGNMLNDALWPAILLSKMPSNTNLQSEREWVLKYGDARNCQMKDTKCERCLSLVTAGDDPSLGTLLSTHNIRTSLELYQPTISLKNLLQDIVIQSRNSQWMDSSACYSGFHSHFLHSWPRPEGMDIFENNDCPQMAASLNFQDSSSLSKYVANSQASFHSASDEDWYVICGESGMDYLVEVECMDSENNCKPSIELYIEEEDRGLAIAQHGIQSLNSASLVWKSDKKGRVYIRVLSKDSTSTPKNSINYRLQVTTSQQPLSTCEDSILGNENAMILAERGDPTNFQVYTPNHKNDDESSGSKKKKKNTVNSVDWKVVLAALLIIAFVMLLGFVGCCYQGEDGV